MRIASTHVSDGLLDSDLVHGRLIAEEVGGNRGFISLEYGADLGAVPCAHDDASDDGMAEGELHCSSG